MRTVRLATAFKSARVVKGRAHVKTTTGPIESRLIINCAGLHADRVARKMGTKPRLRIIPFRGEFYDYLGDGAELLNGLVYPVPNPKMPFLGVHLTPTVDGALKAGPNAILATKREGYERRDFSVRDVLSTLSYGGFWWMLGRYCIPGIAEINRTFRKSAFVKSLQRMVPAIMEEDLVAGSSGVRAQAIDSRGRLVDDFRIEESPGAIHVLNAPSPAATSSLMIGRHLANKADQRLSD